MASAESNAELFISHDFGANERIDHDRFRNIGDSSCLTAPADSGANISIGNTSARFLDPQTAGFDAIAPSGNVRFTAEKLSGASPFREVPRLRLLLELDDHINLVRNAFPFEVFGHLRRPGRGQAGGQEHRA